MKKNQPTTIVFNNEIKDVVYLGKGSFATCYTDGESVYSFVRNDGRHKDYSKEGIALWCNKENPYIPDFEKFGETDDEKSMMFKSPLYGQLTAKNKQAYSEYKLLNSIRLSWIEIKKCHSPYCQNEMLISKFEETGKFSPILIEALRDINSSLTNHGDQYMMEFPKNNLKVDKNGHLILLDIIFNMDALRQIKPKKFVS